VRCEGEPNLRQGEDEVRLDALQHLGLEFLPEAVVKRTWRALIPIPVDCAGDSNQGRFCRVAASGRSGANCGSCWPLGAVPEVTREQEASIIEVESTPN